MQSTGQTSTQALSLTSMHGSTITYVMVVSPSSPPPLSSGVDDSVPRVCEPPASEPAQGRGLQLTNPLPGQPQDRLDLIQRLWRFLGLIYRGLLRARIQCAPVPVKNSIRPPVTEFERHGDALADRVEAQPSSATTGSRDDSRPRCLGLHPRPSRPLYRRLP